MRARNHGTTLGSGGRAPTARDPQARGCIDTLPSGSLRVRVYAGVDPITHRPNYLSHTIPSGPNAMRNAEAAREELITQVREGRQPRTNATLAHLVERHPAVLYASAHTLTSYRGYLHRHITPLIGHFRIKAVTPEILDQFYAELARCRNHCGTPAHRTTTRTTSTIDRAPAKRRHTCRPLSAGSIRKIHFLISAAYTRAQRWKWIHTSPTTLVSPPPNRHPTHNHPHPTTSPASSPTPGPHPPSAS